MLSYQWKESIHHNMCIYLYFITPMLLLLVLNIGVVLSLIIGTRRSRSEVSTNKSVIAQRQLSIIAASVITVFFICESPQAVQRFFRVLGIAVADEGSWSHWINKLGLLLSTVDSAANFFIYLATNRPFRREAFCRKE